MIAIVAHDAGSAELVSSYVQQEKLASHCLFVLTGPACAIFERKLGPLAITPLQDAIARSDWVLCGSGGPATTAGAIKLARQLGKRCAVFLDHWVHYRKRFTIDGVLCLPDEIWVGDKVAQAMALDLFPAPLIRFVANPYFKDIERELAAAPPRVREPGLSILYVCEPVRAHSLKEFGDPRFRGYVEEEALRYFLSNIAVLSAPVRQIVLRPHPSEAADKYAWVVQEFDLPILQSRHATLIEDVAASDVVVGCESMAMVVGLLAGRRVLSCIPPGGKRCALPHPEIEHLQQLLSNAAVAH